MLYISEQYLNYIDQLAHHAATSPHNDLSDPTESQKKAGNYRKGHVKLHGLNISIENPSGSYRSGIDPDGNPWKQKLNNHYGYITGGYIGKDGDLIDVFLGPNHESDKVFIVNQKNHEGSFDEHKILINFDNYKDAVCSYFKNYEPEWEKKGLCGSIHSTDINSFKEWLKNGDTTAPYGEL